MYVELQVAILKAYLHDLDTPICQIVFLGPCRSNLGRPRSGSCALQCASSNTRTCFALSLLRFFQMTEEYTSQKLCLRPLIMQDHYLKVTFLPFVQQL